jgi:hypothetical protein
MPEIEREKIPQLLLSAARFGLEELHILIGLKITSGDN